eukprot:3760812-Prymnesium_polylepis.1
MAACRVPSFPLCHAAGGAGYVMSRNAIGALRRYVASQYPAFLERVDRYTYGGEDVAVAFALKKHAGISVVNAGCMYQHRPDTYAHLHAHGEAWMRWPLSTTPVSFHKYKDADHLRRAFACSLYDARGQPRPAPRSLFVAAALPNGTADGGCGTWAGANATRTAAPPLALDDPVVRSSLTWTTLPEV